MLFSMGELIACLLYVVFRLQDTIPLTSFQQRSRPSRFGSTMSPSHRLNQILVSTKYSIPQFIEMAIQFEIHKITHHYHNIMSCFCMLTQHFFLFKITILVYAVLQLCNRLLSLKFVDIFGSKTETSWYCFFFEWVQLPWP